MLTIARLGGLEYRGNAARFPVGDKLLQKNNFTGRLERTNDGRALRLLFIRKCVVRTSTNHNHPLPLLHRSVENGHPICYLVDAAEEWEHDRTWKSVWNFHMR